MREEILINLTPRETRVAVVENGVLQEIDIERTNRRGLVGNIYHGRVCRVLPGMQSAFLEIGLARTAFLHVADIHIGNKSSDKTAKNSRKEASDCPDISSLLSEGQTLLVQVVKDPIGSKGARLTTQISLPSRYLVFMPTTAIVGVSQRIEDAEERSRLREIMDDVVADSESKLHCGYIVRTASEGIQPERLQQEAKFLCRTWEAINYRLKHHSNEPLVHENPSLMMRTIRDLSINDVERIRIDSLSDYQKVLSFTQKFIPELEERIEHYNKDRPIFDLYSIEDEIQRALERKVVLKSGGYLVVDQTEAMSTIDVNTGAFVGHRNLEETIFKTNLEAAHSIARQLRLRNLGGIIILDFIDMSSERHRSEVMRNLERELEKDHARTCIFPVSELGLVEMTRKRIRESLEHVLCESCPTCSGRGSLKTDETICYDIFREIMRESRQYDDAQQFLVLAHQDVIDRMLDEESHSVAELETCIEKPIRFQSEPLYTREQFDVVLM